MPTILVVDDEPAYRDALRAALQREGFGVDLAADGPDALRRVKASPPDLVLLDLMLPGMSGIDVCREIRKTSAVPIIMVTARDSELETVVGLEVGADDYVTKPFRLRELVARVRATLRRSAAWCTNGTATSVTSGEAIEIGDVRLDGASHEVAVKGEPIHLPRKEFELLELLMLNAGIVITRDTLIDRVWGGDYVGDTKTLDVHVKRHPGQDRGRSHDPQADHHDPGCRLPLREAVTQRITPPAFFVSTTAPAVTVDAKNGMQRLKAATAVIGRGGGLAPSDPRNGRSEKAKIPPSTPTMR